MDTTQDNPSTESVDLPSEHVDQLVAGVWEQILHLPVGTGDAGGSIATSHRQMAAFVQISGRWDGTVSLHCTQDFAAVVAAKMFSIPPADVTPRDELDALGELANMIGGNLKSLLPSPSHLSLPTVIGGASYSARVPGSRVIGRHHYECAGHPFSISVMERQKHRSILAAAG